MLQLDKLSIVYGSNANVYADIVSDMHQNRYIPNIMIAMSKNTIQNVIDTIIKIIVQNISEFFMFLFV